MGILSLYACFIFFISLIFINIKLSILPLLFLIIFFFYYRISCKNLKSEFEENFDLENQK